MKNIPLLKYHSVNKCYIADWLNMFFGVFNPLNNKQKCVLFKQSATKLNRWSARSWKETAMPSDSYLSVGLWTHHVWRRASDENEKQTPKLSLKLGFFSSKTFKFFTSILKSGPRFWRKFFFLILSPSVKLRSHKD